jgi:hypothetical protein
VYKLCTSSTISLSTTWGEHTAQLLFLGCVCIAINNMGRTHRSTSISWVCSYWMTGLYPSFSLVVPMRMIMRVLGWWFPWKRKVGVFLCIYVYIYIYIYICVCVCRYVYLEIFLLRYLFIYVWICLLCRYEPPEVELGEDPTIKSDIFCLSTLMWMINTSEIPFEELGSFVLLLWIINLLNFFFFFFL